MSRFIQTPHRMTQAELIGSSDFLGHDGVHYLGEWEEPATMRDGEIIPGETFALYVLNIRDGHCDVGAHYGPNLWDYVSGHYFPGLPIHGQEMILHAIIRAMQKGLIK